jgi:hypothetical protein
MTVAVPIIPTNAIAVSPEKKIERILLFARPMLASVTPRSVS